MIEQKSSGIVWYCQSVCIKSSFKLNLFLQDSIPNVYSIHCNINQDAQGVGQSLISPVNSETIENYEYDGSIDNDKLKKGLQKTLHCSLTFNVKHGKLRNYMDYPYLNPY